MEERIIELEKKISFQDHEIEKLNEAIMEHQKKIDELINLVIQLKEQKESGSLVKDIEDEEAPPHY